MLESMIAKVGSSVSSACTSICVAACFWPLVGAYYCLKFSIKAAESTIEAGYDVYNRRRIRTRRLPKSKPLLATASSSPQTATYPPTARARTSFLHLPPEIRLHIYRLALVGPAIVQVRTHSSFWGPRPAGWDSAQGIRDDTDAPSNALRCITGLGGSGLHQLVSPPSHGCVRYHAVSRLICGEGHHMVPGWVQPEKVVFPTDLMRSSRVVYGEVLDMLYASNTISLFGADIARYFCRNASPEGLSRVRFVHVALVMPSHGWDSSSQMKNVRGAMRMLKDALPSLQQLDVEVALTYGQPKNPERFWDWLREDVLGQFRGLERFVLKVSVYKPLRPNRSRGFEGSTPQYEPLSSWDDGEYQVLKDGALLSTEAASF
ncbi:uncharacterized protein GGS22DRAFT_172097 [Annulohypoxylon maeteangense]|uniref:uncharacterized protein n=1 Tax=Annulohypoxylon maeteangense TaxID=1927788 RepID=UPI0020086269|nr:uncharacterized protein GGS22DRAFT_172097 [Annulohypoxylon maeteangense]KAI0881410.1 hypothetical protein GGS22DRAFT_172097 [Annulohypoxylon maeteangense]